MRKTWSFRLSIQQLRSILCCILPLVPKEYHGDLFSGLRGGTTMSHTEFCVYTANNVEEADIVRPGWQNRISKQ